MTHWLIGGGSIHRLSERWMDGWMEAWRSIVAIQRREKIVLSD
ncbi:hypothetical protein RISK_000591 [Rhodopirellula islandica]|uniref:Uncharacterized protein n=1 Tax=Rhodopirellula islandica TaxID=595434 RepID=A0A0J1BM27_RHOIS|nr:hypothetical protein RISK_000591 [Rhodopirellula islandica]